MKLRANTDNMSVRKKVASVLLPWYMDKVDEMGDEYGYLAEWWYEIGGTIEIKPHDGIHLIEEKKDFVKAQKSFDRRERVLKIQEWIIRRVLRIDLYAFM